MSQSAQLATLFGIGRVPAAPGTAASLVAAAVAWPIAWFIGREVLFGLSLAAALLGIVVSGNYARECGREDPPECVIDELAGQWLVCAFAPVSLLGYGSLVGYGLAFALFRLFDIAKPWPVSAAERLKGGVGIVADDMIAGLFAGFIVMLFDISGFL